MYMMNLFQPWKFMVWIPSKNEGFLFAFVCNHNQRFWCGVINWGEREYHRRRVTTHCILLLLSFLVFFLLCFIGMFWGQYSTVQIPGVWRECSQVVADGSAGRVVLYRWATVFKEVSRATVKRHAVAEKHVSAILRLEKIEGGGR